jgi:hypothetical protein
METTPLLRCGYEETSGKLLVVAASPTPKKIKVVGQII